MTNKEFVAKLLDIANNCKTVYMMGTFGAPVSESLIAQKTKQYPDYYSAGRRSLLKGHIPLGSWAFDCVGLIKGVLWGWRGDRTVNFGGAKYKANDVPDISANTMAKRCLERSTTMDGLLVGEAVYMDRHIGVYVGNGKVVESTLIGKLDGVVITDLSFRKWLGHGKLPWITYETEEIPAEEKTEEKPEEVQPIQVGDVVTFAGGKHYVSSNGSLGYKAKPGPAKVTHFVAGRKHPYHLIHTDKTSNVHGWVNADTVSK
ncbi:MAG: hypothetical protein IIY12_06415 [Clostridia bacterium]|nr:hypothetical protein [Clostridia bacterium]